MSARGDSLFVRHMRDAIDRMTSYLEGVTKEEYARDFVLQDAVVRQLEILGEAACRVSGETTGAHPEVPWSKVTGMRHRLIHDYFEVDIDLVWATATDRAAELRPTLVALLEEMGVSE